MKFKLRNHEILIVRRPEIKDAKALIQHMKTVDQETKFLGREPGEFQSTIEQEEAFIQNLQNKQSCFLLAILNDQIVGNVSVNLIRHNLRFLHRASMGITIQKSAWGLGIGRILMQEAIKWCEMNHVEQLELDVVTSNERAIQLYQSFGFVIQGHLYHALKYEDGSYADEYKMILKIDNDTRKDKERGKYDNEFTQ